MLAAIASIQGVDKLMRSAVSHKTKITTPEILLRVTNWQRPGMMESKSA
jgi:hypothetical protein